MQEERRKKKELDKIHERNTNAKGTHAPPDVIPFNSGEILGSGRHKQTRLFKSSVNEGGSLFITSTNINILMALKWIIFPVLFYVLYYFTVFSKAIPLTLPLTKAWGGLLRTKVFFECISNSLNCNQCRAIFFVCVYNNIIMGRHLGRTSVNKGVSIQILGIFIEGATLFCVNIKFYRKYESQAHRKSLEIGYLIRKCDNKYTFWMSSPNFKSISTHFLMFLCVRCLCK